MPFLYFNTRFAWFLFSSLSTTRVRQRLCDLMGTDVIRLNDKRYFQTLTQRLQDEYEVIHEFICVLHVFTGINDTGFLAVSGP